MFVRFSAASLALALLAGVAESAPPVSETGNLKRVLDDPTGDLSRVAKGILGERGGNQLFYFPTHDEPATPATWGFNFDNVDFKSADGTRIHGWFVPAHDANAEGTVVFSHGNAGSMGHHLGFVMWLAEAGYNVLMYDYRGFGKSGGSVGRRGMIDDVKAAFEETLPQPDPFQWERQPRPGALRS